MFRCLDLHGRAKVLGGLVDGEPVKAGQVVRIVTTGGGGWGDPLEREPELVRRYVVQEKVSLAVARRDQGVVLHARETEIETEYDVDETTTARLRAERRATRHAPLPLIDRGPGYEAASVRGKP